MNTAIGAASKATVVLLFRYLVTHRNQAEQLRLAVPPVWFAIPLLMLVGFFGGAAMIIIEMYKWAGLVAAERTNGVFSWRGADCCVSRPVLAQLAARGRGSL